MPWVVHGVGGGGGEGARGAWMVVVAPSLNCRCAMGGAWGGGGGGGGAVGGGSRPIAEQVCHGWCLEGGVRHGWCVGGGGRR